MLVYHSWGFPGGSVLKNLPADAGFSSVQFSRSVVSDSLRPVGSIPESGRSPGEGNGNPLQYSFLGNPMDRGVWWAIVHGVAKELDRTEWLNNNNSNVQCSNFSTSSLTPIFHFYKNYVHPSGCEVKVKTLSHFQLFATPWTVAYQAPLSMGFSRQEYQSGLLVTGI